MALYGNCTVIFLGVFFKVTVQAFVYVSALPA